ncbi:DUF3472 domain-containing protein [Roseateles sp. BYS180W]|uniref:DUF3472 domain-containing protein n=1 Tax=Roseateles rivi TaxID=3299028 RepID=A0ABW7FU46_9BURK
MALPAHAVVAGGMVSNTFTADAVNGGYTELNADIRVTLEPGSNGRTFWANQFTVGNNTGYIGMQQTSGDTKLVIFSIWNAVSGTPGTGASCESFSHEGSGTSCKLSYPWVEGKKYRFRLYRTSKTSSAEVWRGSVMDVATGQTQVIGDIRQGVQASGLGATLEQFVENFAQGSEQYSSCSQVAPAVAVFSRVMLGSSAAKSASTYTYGNCANVAKSYCTADRQCVATVNTARLPTGNFRLKNPVNALCADTLGSGTALGLYYCQANNANQTLTHSASGQLRLTQRSLCLQASADGAQVQAATCSNRNLQAWVPMGKTQALFNVGTESCLDAADGATASAKVQVTGCNGLDYQKWQANQP